MKLDPAGTAQPRNSLGHPCGEYGEKGGKRPTYFRNSEPGPRTVLCCVLFHFILEEIFAKAVSVGIQLLSGSWILLVPTDDIR